MRLGLGDWLFMNDADPYRSALSHPATNDERFAAALAHGGTCFAWFLAPLFVYLLKRKDSRHVEYQALQALVWSLLGTALGAATSGLVVPVFLGFHLYAAYKELQGRSIDYPLASDIARGLMDRNHAGRTVG